MQKHNNDFEEFASAQVDLCMESDESVPILCNAKITREKHVCAIFNSSDEENTAIGEFLALGHRQGRKIMAMIDPQKKQSMVELLRHHGVDAGQAEVQGKFDLRTWTETYLREPTFGPEAMAAFVENTMLAAREAGHKSVWAVGDMSWLQLEPEASLRLVVYEILIQKMKPRFADDVFVCYYDANKFSGRVIADVIRAHPIVLLGTTLYENPYYAAPEVFLKELEDWYKISPRRYSS